MTDNWTHVDHPEDERYDAIDIRCVERWKESELSGDEWRFSYVAYVKRKGEIIFEIGASTLDWLLKGLSWRMVVDPENDNFDYDAWDRVANRCDQPGCPRVATIFFQRLKRYTKRGEALLQDDDRKEYRKFCNNHKYRGDCGLDDADHNYKEIADPTPVPVQTGVAPE